MDFCIHRKKASGTLLACCVREFYSMLFVSRYGVEQAFMPATRLPKKSALAAGYWIRFIDKICRTV
jgi:hypothetical protein